MTATEDDVAARFTIINNPTENDDELQIIDVCHTPDSTTPETKSMDRKADMTSLDPLDVDGTFSDPWGTDDGISLDPLKDGSYLDPWYDEKDCKDVKEEPMDGTLDDDVMIVEPCGESPKPVGHKGGVICIEPEVPQDMSTPALSYQPVPPSNAGQETGLPSHEAPRPFHDVPRPVHVVPGPFCNILPKPSHNSQGSTPDFTQQLSSTGLQLIQVSGPTLTESDICKLRSCYPNVSVNVSASSSVSPRHKNSGHNSSNNSNRSTPIKFHQVSSSLMYEIIPQGNIGKARSRVSGQRQRASRKNSTQNSPTKTATSNEQISAATSPILSSMLTGFFSSAQTVSKSSTTQSQIRQSSGRNGHVMSKTTVPNMGQSSMSGGSYSQSTPSSWYQAAATASNPGQSSRHNSSFTSKTTQRDSFQTTSSYVDQSSLRQSSLSQTAPSNVGQSSDVGRRETGRIMFKSPTPYLDQSSVRNSPFLSQTAPSNVGQSSSIRRTSETDRRSPQAAKMSGGSMEETPVPVEKAWKSAFLNSNLASSTPTKYPPYPRSYLKLYAYALYNYQQRQKAQRR